MVPISLAALLNFPAAVCRAIMADSVRVPHGFVPRIEPQDQFPIYFSLFDNSLLPMMHTQIPRFVPVSFLIPISRASSGTIRDHEFARPVRSVRLVRLVGLVGPYESESFQRSPGCFFQEDNIKRVTLIHSHVPTFKRFHPNFSLIQSPVSGR